MGKQNELLINEAKSNNLAVKSNKQIEEMQVDLMLSIVRSSNGEVKLGDTTERLYNKGYRKASDVAREIFGEIEEYLIKECNEANDFNQRKMIRGSRERFYEGAHFYLEAAVKFVAELKKKYIGEDTNVHTNT